MELFTTIKGIQQALAADKSKGLSIGFVPTMGALHQGHLSLVERAGLENERVVVSIFVNPTQFNNPSDLNSYPRTLDSDMQLLSSYPCDYVFSPEVAEIYPEPDTQKFNFGTLETVMEGHFRPGHFNGVAQVVSKLFEIVKPDNAYFGLKDFQQYSIIKAMCTMLELPVRIVPCEIVRERDGLAMSSRNALLSEKHRAVAPQIFSILQEAVSDSEFFGPEEIKKLVTDKIDLIPLLQLEYFDIVDGLSLQNISSWEHKGLKVGCIAVFAGSVRLIDNIVFAK
ncbi:MAG: pantoate--beta-alanine ligase [Prolixibacteraceae bacterium]